MALHAASAPHPKLRRAWLIVVWIGVIIVTILSLVPHPPELEVAQGDKIQHFLAYGSLMLWFAQVRIDLHARLVTGAALVAMGVGLEFAQSLTGFRLYSYADMAANTTGVVLGWLAAPPRLPNAFHLAGRWVAR